MTDTPAAIHPDEIARRLGHRPDGLADIQSFQMTEATQQTRRQFVNCSELKIIASGEPEPMNKLAQIKWGERDPDALDDVLNVFMGNWMEPAILAWLEQQEGLKVTRMREKVTARRRPWLSCTLDGFTEWKGLRWVVQTKFFSPWMKIPEALAACTAQCIGETYCTDADGTLLVIYNQGNKLIVLPIEQDPVALTEMLELADGFWDAVQEKRLPNPVAAKVKLPVPARMGERDMTGDNAYADAAARWIEGKAASEGFAKAQEDLKKLIPDGIAKVFGHGVQITVSKSGSKTIKTWAPDAAVEEAA